MTRKPASDTPNRTKSWLIFALVCIVTLIVAELGAWAIMAVGYSGYPSSAETLAFLERDTSDTLADDWRIREGGGSRLPHPYTGFTLDRSGERVFADGLISGDPPSQGDQDACISILILGGSVALQLMDVDDVLRAEISRIFECAPENVAIANAALPGGKQPQQLFMLQYLLLQGYRFDVVLNVDGFNEVALPPAHNVPSGQPIDYPVNWSDMARAWADSRFVALAADVAALKREREDTRRLFGGGLLRFSQVARLGFNALDRRTENRLKAARRALIDYREHGADPPARRSAMAIDAIYERARDIWFKSSLAIQDVCRTRGMRYFHYLQPNIHIPDSKPLNTEERGLLATHGDPYGPYAAAGYPSLIEAGQRLSDAGVSYRDLTQLFKNEALTVFSDSCCHFTRHGNEAIARAMARELETARP